FFLPAEDGIRDFHVTGVQTCALPICLPRRARAFCDVLTSGAFFLFAGTVLYFGASMAWDSLSRLEHSQSAWNPPLYPVKLTIPQIGSASCRARVRVPRVALLC